MQFLVVFKRKPDVTDAMFGSVIRQENEAAWALMMNGVLRSVWYLPHDPAKGEGPGGNVCLLECADEADARKRVGRFPLVQNRCVDFELMQLNPFNGFEMLFARDD